MDQDLRKKSSKEVEFFTEYGDANRYRILEIIGKGSYGVVCAAIDTHTGEKVAIKKINDIFEHISDAIRILREVKLLRLLRHPDIVEIKRIMIPPSRRDFKDIYVVFELMESDLHQVIKANDDLTQEHHRFFLYQMLRALKYMHTANVYHRDLKPKNILANANCKLKICDFGLARVAFSDTPTTVFWTDYVATRWYRAPELCGSFFSKYTPAIDIWSIGCIFAEVLTGKPLFPGKSVIHQLELITDLLGTPSVETVSGVRNEKARKYLMDMRKKNPVSFTQKFHGLDPLAVRLLQRLLAFDPKDRPTAEQALADPYFKGLAKIEREPSCQQISKLEFEFERRRLTKDDVRDLIFREILEYHPQLLKDYLSGNEATSYLYPSAIGHFRRQFAYLEEMSGKSGPVIPPERKHVSLPRSTVNTSTVPPKTQPTASMCDHRRVTEEVYAGVRVTETACNHVPKVSRPPPPVPVAAAIPRVVGPVLPLDSERRTRECHNGHLCSRNPVMHPLGVPSHYYVNRNNSVKNEKQCVADTGKDSSHQIMMKQQPDVQPDAKQAPPRTNASGGVINRNPYYHQTHTNNIVQLNSQMVALDAKLMQQAQTHREVGAVVQYGLI
ncbi:unnamed protein product [Cuscuta europaea]|uniref:mitogen-activated protein kinase n=2 Tax=Cuscuta europaea TaxID=41803 RepID=A0A9P1ECS6_CUSEU|nr:unnamed protein product [Cuscuta europaea]